ncbi:hypothetical protein Dda_5724 [Drechslerella dactyloides]|uniref:3-phytase n=1 Tax=Drechslerella dactyloides TaxID=74499 RepID=A0AAD6NKG5_DREDA|nr:hypothetical protein Dda_5724 [Drechslerella dactyloides]
MSARRTVWIRRFGGLLLELRRNVAAWLEGRSHDVIRRRVASRPSRLSALAAASAGNSRSRLVVEKRRRRNFPGRMDATSRLDDDTAVTPATRRLGVSTASNASRWPRQPAGLSSDYSLEALDGINPAPRVSLHPVSDADPYLRSYSPLRPTKGQDGSHDGRLHTVILQVNRKFCLAKLRARWYKAAILLTILLFIITNWRRSCITSTNYTHFDSNALYNSEACSSLIVFTANMFIWGLIGPVVLLTELVTGKPISRRGDCTSLSNGYTCHKDISRSWGPYTPWFSVESKSVNPAIAGDCKITFAQVLSRHGARYPTKGAGQEIKATIKKIQANATSYSKRTAFIKDFKYSLGSDDLTKFGAQELYNSGAKFYRRYKDLANLNEPFVRISGQERVIDSGLNFTKGFVDEKKANTGAEMPPFPAPVIISEAENSNNTLKHGNCRAFEDGKFSKIGDEAQATFAKQFATRIAETLNKDIPGANINGDDAINLMSLCPFLTVAQAPEDSLPQFCKIFKEAEFAAYNYYQNLGKFYGHGPGNPLGPAQGVGFANELIARLTDTPVNDSTTTNTTLNSDPKTFPLGKKLYADFSHDNTMVSIFSALNLFGDLRTISKEKIESLDKFNVAEIVPFASRMYVEKLACGGSKDEELVRVLINDKVMKLTGCQEQRDGACKLSDFIRSLDFARRGGNWAECGR